MLFVNPVDPPYSILHSWEHVLYHDVGLVEEAFHDVVAQHVVQKILENVFVPLQRQAGGSPEGNQDVDMLLTSHFGTFFPVAVNGEFAYKCFIASSEIASRADFAVFSIIFFQVWETV